VGDRVSRLVAAIAAVVAGVIAVRRSQRGFGQVIPATSTPVDSTSRAVLARPEAPPRQAAATAPHCAEEPIPTQTGDSPGPDSPLQLHPTDWKASVKRAAKEFKDDRATLTSAGMAFFWFLSIFPAMLAFIGVLGLVDASEGAIESITEVIESALPGDAEGVLIDAINASRNTDGSVVGALLGIALALWSASSG